jgi:hypothetical protein
MYLSMRLSKAVVVSLADDISVMNDHGTDHRVRCHRAPATLREFKGAAHEAFVMIHTGSIVA